MKSVEIVEIKARKILDSRGNPTIETDVLVNGGGEVGEGRAAAPSGASRGVHEVVAFADDSPDKSLEELEKVKSDIIGFSFSELASFDRKMRELDGTEDFRKIGGNAVVALSMAAAKTMAASMGTSLYRSLRDDEDFRLPYPLGNVLGGGEHAGKTAPDIQEFLVLPLGADSFVEAAFANAKVHARVEELVDEEDETFTGGKSDEGAWAPNVSDEKALELVARACEQVSDEEGFEIKPGLDVAAGSLFDSDKGVYQYRREGEFLDTGEQIDLMLDYIKTYDLAYVEDPVDEEDFESFSEITAEVGDECLICGDDLYVTNVDRIERGMEIDATTAVLIKPNQIGNLTATRKAVELSKADENVPVISHRSGETTDNTIAQLAVGFGCPVIKTGVVGGERIAKLNELIRVEEILGKEAKMGVL